VGNYYYYSTLPGLILWPNNTEFLQLLTHLLELLRSKPGLDPSETYTGSWEEIVVVRCLE
jgi:hypothetical protein